MGNDIFVPKVPMVKTFRDYRKRLECKRCSASRETGPRISFLLVPKQTISLESGLAASQHSPSGGGKSSYASVLNEVRQANSINIDIEETDIAVCDTCKLQELLLNPLKNFPKEYPWDAGGEFLIERALDQFQMRKDFGTYDFSKESGNSFLKMNRRFQNASQIAYMKLQQNIIERSDEGSEGLLKLFLELGSQNDINKRGIKAIESILKHDVFSSLLDVYSFLHVAYAMSQVEKAEPCRNTPAEFQSGLQLLRNFLDPRPDPHTQCCETDVFDEIVKIMWSEIDQAMGWLNSQKGLDFMKTLKKTARKLKRTRNLLKRLQEARVVTPSKFDEAHSKGRALTSNPSLRYLSDGGVGGSEEEISTAEYEEISPSNSSTWGDIVAGSIFGIILNFFHTTVYEPWDELFLVLTTTAYSFLLMPFSNLSGLEQNNCDCLINHIRVEEAMQIIPVDIFNIVYEYLWDGVISTIRGFENYLLWIGRILSANSQQLLEITEAVLRQCAIWADKHSYQVMSQPPWDEEYSISYIKKRFVVAAEENGQQRSTTLSPRAKLDKFSPATSSVTSADSTSAHISICFTDEMDHISTPQLIYDHSTPSNAIEPSAVNEVPQRAAIICRYLNCGRQFTIRSNLLRHERDHRENALFICNYNGCTKVFKRADNVHKHRKITHGLNTRVGIDRL